MELFHGQDSTALWLQSHYKEAAYFFPDRESGALTTTPLLPKMNNKLTEKKDEKGIKQH